MNKKIKQLFSFILPITVLLVVPLCIERNIIIQNAFVFGIGIALIAAGLSLLITTISKLTRFGDGTLAPWSPTKKLVMLEIYRYVRNPMIIGVLIILLGESAAIQSMSILKWAGIFFTINNIYFVLYEEPNLEKRFGKEYREYKRQVPRWIPRLKAYSTGSKK